MIALDTKILLRLILNDEPSLCERATRLVSVHCSEADPGFIPVSVIQEVFFVLLRVYNDSKAEVAGVFRDILNTTEFVVQLNDEVARAVSDFEQGAGFEDALIEHLAKSEGCPTTYTLDEKAARLPTFTLV